MLFIIFWPLNPSVAKIYGDQTKTFSDFEALKLYVQDLICFMYLRIGPVGS